MLAEHPDTASILAGMGTLYLEQGKYRLAEPLLRRALAMQDKFLGSAHPDTIGTLGWVASLYRRWGRIREAVKYERKLKQLQKKRK